MSNDANTNEEEEIEVTRTVREVRMWGVRLPPFFALNFSLVRSPSGAHASLSLHIWKIGFHFGLSAID